MSHGFGNARSQGPSGFSGISGYSGISGFSGFSGASPTLGPGVIVALSASANVTNNAAETSLLTSYLGSKTLAPDYFYAGKTIQYVAYGNMLNQIVLATIVFRVKLGSHTLVSFQSQNGGNAINATTNTFWRMEGEFRCMTTGSSGTFITNSIGIFPATNTTFSTVYHYNRSITVNTTSSLTLDFTVENANSTAQNIVLENFFAKSIG